LAGILAALLEREAVGVDDDFFALGGDSLLAVSYAARAKAAGLPFAAAAIFQYPTIAQLAAQIPLSKPTVPSSLAPQVHRFRLSGIAASDFVTWAPLGGPHDPAALAQALAQVRAQTSALGHAINARGRLWRPAAATAGDLPVLLCERDALFQARATLDLTHGLGLLAVIQGDQSLLVAHPALVDGLSLDTLAAQVRSLLGHATAPVEADTPDLPDLSPADWDALLAQGPASPWWIGPQDQPPSGPYSRLRTSVGPASAATLEAAFLSAVTALAGKTPVLVDLERPSAEIGPLFAVPTLASTGTSGSSASYRAWLEHHRPTAGGPGLLLRRSLSPEAWQADTLARGVDRLYRLVAGWQAQDGQTLIEVAAADTSLARDLAAAWARALRAGGVDA
jgi:aryl carrier-like protein